MDFEGPNATILQSSSSYDSQLGGTPIDAAGLIGIDGSGHLHMLPRSVSVNGVTSLALYLDQSGGLHAYGVV
jgi:hypothetical protein